MMYIDYTVRGKDTPATAIWQIGEDLTKTNPQVDASIVVSVQADSDELMHIINTLTNFPYHRTRRVQRWFGDDAKFIVGNL